MQVQIVKYELYPKDNPTGYAVGFNVKTSVRDIYRDTIVSLNDIVSTDTEVDIVSKAWAMLQTNILDEVNRLEGRPKVIGGVYVPDTGEVISDSEYVEVTLPESFSRLDTIEDILLSNTLDLITIMEGE
jgi:hypothetical protein